MIKINNQSGNSPVGYGTTTATPGKLYFQTDGNIVVSQANGQSQWSTNTAGTSGPGLLLKVQNDGNLVMYDSTSKAYWNSNTKATNFAGWGDAALDGYTMCTCSSITPPTNYYSSKSTGQFRI